jgi:hypothetical protein
VFFSQFPLHLLSYFPALPVEPPGYGCLVNPELPPKILEWNTLEIMKRQEQAITGRKSP